MNKISSAIVDLGFLTCIPSSAQELRGTVQGVVTDSSGSVVPGANVTLRNTNTIVQTTRASNSRGSWRKDSRWSRTLRAHEA